MTSRRSEREPWNGEFDVSFGDSDSRSWDEARRHGFISAGGGSWYSGTLSLLNVNDRVWVRVPQRGYVGVGRVLGKPEPASEYRLPGPDGEPRPALEVLTEARYHREFVDDPERAEYFVPVEWLATVPVEQAVHEVGMFGNQNTVCAPKTPGWRRTVDRLKEHFDVSSG